MATRTTTTIIRAAVFLVLATCASAFVPRPAPRAFFRRGAVIAAAGAGAVPGKSGVAPAMPERKRPAPRAEEKRLDPKQPEREVAEPKERREKKTAPQWRVMLLGDEAYDKAVVVAGIREVCRGLSAAAAEKCYAEAQASEKAQLTVAPLETAEAFVQALHRMDPIIYAIVEPEDKTPG